jgi:hypothetical protein
MILNFLKGFYVNGKRKPTAFEGKIKRGIKKHTLREDIHDRWKPGMKIHFSTGAQTSKYNCFKEGVCNGVQKVEIIDRNIYIADRLIPLSKNQIEIFAFNDGFDSVSDFWAWFDQYNPFIGKIIHWTNLRY